jgi:hypothetical protein
MRHYDAAEARCAQLDGRMQTTSRVGADEIGHDQMRSKSKAAWETAARCATLIEEADDPRGARILFAPARCVDHAREKM